MAARAVLAWASLAVAILLPVALAATSPLLAWRQPVHVVAGFAGILALGLVLVQPLLARGLLPGLTPRESRRLHRLGGAALAVLVLAHVGGLWLASPPDVVDALLLRAPTLFSPFGVVAMWAVLVAALLAALRRRMAQRLWRRAHLISAAVIAGASVAHALPIVGTMETVTKSILSALVLAAAIRALAAPRPGRAR